MSTSITWDTEQSRFIFDISDSADSLIVYRDEEGRVVVDTLGKLPELTFLTKVINFIVRILLNCLQLITSHQEHRPEFNRSSHKLAASSCKYDK